MKLMCAIAMTLFGATAAQAAQQLDLVCEGTRQTEPDGPKEPHSFRIIVDLDEMAFCKDACDTMWDIDGVNPAEIIFTEPGGGRIHSDQRVSRRTGAYEWTVISTGPSPWYEKTEAQCGPAEFSGFPTTRF